MLRYILIICFVCTGFYFLPAQQLRDKISFGITNGSVMPGPLSHGGSAFVGYKRELFIGFVWPNVKSHWGIESDIGFAKIRYKSRLEDNFSFIHRQSCAAISLMGFVKMAQSINLKVGINCFFPINYMILVTQKNNSSQKSFSNSDLIEGYFPTTIQAGASIGMDYLIGKKQKFTIGCVITQMGNAAIKSERNYHLLGIPVTLSNKTRPMHFDIRVAFHLSAKKKDRSKQDD